MKQTINQYIKDEVLAVVKDTIIDKLGSISTNTAEGVMSMIAGMASKKRYCGVVLYCVRSHIGVLQKNQKYYTKAFKNKELSKHVHWLPMVLRAVGLQVTEAQQSLWKRVEISKIIADEKQRTESAKIKRIVKKKARNKSYSKAKKEGASGRSFVYESGGGMGRVQAARNRRENAEYEQETQESVGLNTTTVPKNDIVTTKLGQKQIKSYLINKMDAVAFDQLPKKRQRGWVQEWRDALQNYIESVPGDTVDVPSDWLSNPNPNTFTDPPPAPGTLIEWEKTDVRLDALKRVQIRD